MKKYITLKFLDFMDHKQFEVGWIYQVVQVDRSKEEVTLEFPNLERLEDWMNFWRHEQAKDRK